MPRRADILVIERRVIFLEVIYADVYFIVNLSMDFLALFIAAKLRRLKVRALRTLFASAVGAGYAVAELFIGGRLLPALLALAIPVLMCFIAFGFGKPGHFTLNVITFWLVSWLMGGLLTAVYYVAGKIFESKKIYINGRTEVLYSDIPFWVIIAIALSCAAITLIWNRLAEKRRLAARAHLTVENDGVRIEEEGLCDSGNLLTEPIGGLPVIILSPDLMSALLPLGVESLMNGDSADMLKVRIIPYNTVSGNGILYGCIPDRLTVNGVERRACICSGGDLTFSFGECRAIVPASLL